MRFGIKHTLVPTMGLALTALLTSPASVMAQDKPGGGANVFKMFFAPIPDSPDFLDWLGVAMVWLLIIISVGTMALILQYFLKNRKPNLVPDETRAQLEQLMTEKRYAEAIQLAQADTSYLGKVASASLGEAANGFGSMERALEESADAETTKLLRPLEILNIIANVAPMIGLFGTVYGMIVAFQRLVLAGGKPDPSALAGGISTALVTTLWGLVIAVPAMVAYAIIRNNIDMHTTDGMLTVESLIKPFKPGRKAAATSSSSTPPASAAQRPRATPKPPEAGA